ncbi:MAG: diguanylate cyclase [Gammaproteobacteria bacterium]|nr:diguanylate cyclase [Gammaproteobacteria bacterium]
MSQNSEIETTCFQHNPCGVLATDKAGSILQLNQSLASILGLPADRFVGKNQESLQASPYHALFNGEGMVHLAGPDIDQEKWLLCTVYKGPSSIIRFYQDATEQVELKHEVNALHQQVEDLTITDELTGLSNPRAFNRALNSQVTRSRRYNNPLCLAVMELADESNPDTSVSDDAILATSRHLRDRLRWVDTIARWDHNHFAIILPETNAEHGNDLIGKISSGFSEIEIPSLQEGQVLKLGFGIAQWMKGNDSRILMNNAALNLNLKKDEQSENASS